jgi:TonB family protein
MTKVLIVLFFLCCCSMVFGQAEANPYALRGAIRDQDGAVVPALRLEILGGAKPQSAYTDINGEFDIPLSPGEYVMTAAAISADKLRAFINVSKGSLKPGYLAFSVDSNAIQCSKVNGKELPKIIASAVPIYPAAAQAVWAIGEVEILVAIRPDGTVYSATPVSGHPLLKAAAKVAAQKFRFEPATEPDDRKLVLVFVFLLNQTKKDGLKRYECPYRIVKVPTGEIDISDNKIPQ